MRPFRFGVQVAADQASHILGQSREIEELGFTSILVPDHMKDHLSPIALLPAIVAETRAAHVGTLVLNAALRNPAIMAADAHTLRQVCGGRFELGLGAGWNSEDFAASGVPFPCAEKRLAALEQGLEHWKRLDDEPRTHRAPLLIGGGGRRLLTLAAEQADIIGVHVPMRGTTEVSRANGSAATEQRFSQRIDWIRAAAGPRFTDLELSVFTVLCKITTQGAELRSRFAQLIGVQPHEVDRSPLSLVGSVDEIVGLLQERRERFGLSYIIVPAKAAKSFAPVVERLHGK